MDSVSRQTGEDEFFARTPEFEPLKGLRNPESNKSNPLLMMPRHHDFPLLNSR